MSTERWNSVDPLEGYKNLMAELLLFQSHFAASDAHYEHEAHLTDRLEALWEEMDERQQSEAEAFTGACRKALDVDTSVAPLALETVTVQKTDSHLPRQKAA